MSKQEFIRRRDSFRNRSAIGAFVIFAVMIGSVFVANWIGKGFKDWRSIILILVFLSSLPTMLIYTLRLERRMGLTCPHCRKGIAGISTVVIATNNCGHCGETVF